MVQVSGVEELSDGSVGICLRVGVGEVEAEKVVVSSSSTWSIVVQISSITSIVGLSNAIVTMSYSVCCRSIIVPS
jgi:hypothetical protein